MQAEDILSLCRRCPKDKRCYVCYGKHHTYFVPGDFAPGDICSSLNPAALAFTPSVAAVSAVA
ncbi:hypothetical protein V5799_030306, partial [Amblyomma americanum]